VTELAITNWEERPVASSADGAPLALSLAHWRLPQLAASAMDEAALTLSLARWGLPRLTATMTVDQLVRAAALGLALFGHATVLYALAREPLDLMAGGGGQQLDSISVTIVSSSVLEARETERLQQSAAAAAATVEATDGAPDSAPAAAAEQREAKKEQDKEQKREKPTDESVRAVEAITEVPVQARRQRRRQQASAAAAASGGAAARSDRPSDAKASAAAAAASAGAVREYARYVALALAKTKPKGAGGLGTVRIKFVVAADGALASAEIAKSSGSKRLDDTALAAVRRAIFPSPPRGMGIAQLTYEVPYHFR